MLAAQLKRGQTRLMLLQDADDLFFHEPGLFIASREPANFKATIFRGDVTIGSAKQNFFLRYRRL